MHDTGRSQNIPSVDVFKPDVGTLATSNAGNIKSFPSLASCFTVAGDKREVRIAQTPESARRKTEEEADREARSDETDSIVGMEIGDGVFL